MKTRTRSFVMLAATLLIGVIIGALVGGVLRERRWQKISLMTHEQRFRAALQNDMQPSPEQRAVIDTLLAREFKPITRLQGELQKQVFALYDSLREKLQPVLDERQAAALHRVIAAAYYQRLLTRTFYLAEMLQLTKEQKQSLEQALREVRQPREAEPKDFAAQRAAGRKRLEDFYLKFESLLTPEQKQKYHALQQEWQTEEP